MVTARNAAACVREILEKANNENAAQETNWIIQHAVGKAFFEIKTLTNDENTKALQFAKERAGKRPLQYIFGEWPFLNINLKVGEGVLIPRPETEELAILALECVKNLIAPVILDLCAGTGAIGLSLQDALPQAKLTLIELKAEAYYYLQQNALALFENAVHMPSYLQADVFEFQALLKAETLDLLVCNPPYVSHKEYGEVEDELLFEPKSALVAEKNGLQFYLHIAKEYKFAIKKGGWLVFEIGALQASAVRKLLEENNYEDIQICKDMFGNDRIALARKS